MEGRQRQSALPVSDTGEEHAHGHGEGWGGSATNTASPGGGRPLVHGARLPLLPPQLAGPSPVLLIGPVNVPAFNYYPAQEQNTGIANLPDYYTSAMLNQQYPAQEQNTGSANLPVSAPPAHSSDDVPLPIGLVLPQVTPVNRPDPVLFHVPVANPYAQPNFYQRSYHCPVGMQQERFVNPYGLYQSMCQPQRQSLPNIFQMAYTSASVGMQQQRQSFPYYPAHMQQHPQTFQFYHPSAQMECSSTSSSSSDRHAPWRRQLQQDYTGQARDSSSATVHHPGTLSLAGQTPEASAPDSTEQVVDVWAHNADVAFHQISRHMKSVSEDKLMVSIDSEFAIPDDCVPHVGEPPNPEAFYRQTRAMVNGGNIIQFGVVLATHRRILGIWQMNLHFSPSWHLADHKGIRFLRQDAGIDFDQHESQGIRPAVFTAWLKGSGLMSNENVIWITFGGCNDLGYLTHYVTGAHLPQERLQFLQICRELFPLLYDVRIFTKLGRCRKEVIHGGLSQVCERLEVNTAGLAHTAACL